MVTKVTKLSEPKTQPGTKVDNSMYIIKLRWIHILHVYSILYFSIFILKLKYFFDPRLRQIKLCSQLSTFEWEGEGVGRERGGESETEEV